MLKSLFLIFALLVLPCAGTANAQRPSKVPLSDPDTSTAKAKAKAITAAKGASEDLIKQPTPREMFDGQSFLPSSRKTFNFDPLGEPRWKGQSQIGLVNKGKNVELHLHISLGIWDEYTLNEIINWLIYHHDEMAELLTPLTGTLEKPLGRTFHVYDDKWIPRWLFEGLQERANNKNLTIVWHGEQKQ